MNTVLIIIAYIAAFFANYFVMRFFLERVTIWKFNKLDKKKYDYNKKVIDQLQPIGFEKL